MLSLFLLAVSVTLVSCMHVHLKTQDHIDAELASLGDYELMHIDIVTVDDVTRLIEFDAFGQHYEVQFHLNTRLHAKNSAFLHPDGKTVMDARAVSRTHSCHYFGTVLNTNDARSVASASLCEGFGFTARISAFGKTLIIKPSAVYFDREKDLGSTHQLDDELLVYQIKNGEYDPLDETMDMVQNKRRLAPWRPYTEEFPGTIDLFIIFGPERYLAYSKIPWAFLSIYGDVESRINAVSAIYYSTDWGDSVGSLQVVIKALQIVPFFGWIFMPGPLPNDDCEDCIQVLSLYDSIYSYYSEGIGSFGADWTQFDMILFVGDLKLGLSSRGTAIRGTARSYGMCLDELFPEEDSKVAIAMSTYQSALPIENYDTVTDPVHTDDFVVCPDNMTTMAPTPMPLPTEMPTAEPTFSYSSPERFTWTDEEVVISTANLIGRVIGMPYDGDCPNFYDPLGAADCAKDEGIMGSKSRRAHSFSPCSVRYMQNLEWYYYWCLANATEGQPSGWVGVSVMNQAAAFEVDDDSLYDGLPMLCLTDDSTPESWCVSNDDAVSATGEDADLYNGTLLSWPQSVSFEISKKFCSAGELAYVYDTYSLRPGTDKFEGKWVFATASGSFVMAYCEMELIEECTQGSWVLSSDKGLDDGLREDLPEVVIAGLTVFSSSECSVNESNDTQQSDNVSAGLVPLVVAASVVLCLAVMAALAYAVRKRMMIQKTMKHMVREEEVDEDETHEMHETVA